MKYTWLAASFLSLALLCPWPSMAQDVLNLRGIGKMNIPQKITFQKGQQEALPFMADGGAKKYFLRKGLTEDTFYTMTYSNPPDYNYGWALSQKLGITFLFAIGEIAHKDDSPEAKMDLFANYFNQQIMDVGATYEGDTPLIKSKDKNHLRWEGSFTIRTKEKNIYYNEAYQMVLQCDGYFTTLGIFATDADAKDVTAAIAKMVQKRKLPEKTRLADLSKRGTSLTEYGG